MRQRLASRCIKPSTWPEFSFAHGSRVHPSSGRIVWSGAQTECEPPL